MKTKHKILLADDEPQNIKDLVAALSCEQYELFVAPNGKIAYEQAIEIKPDAIIMDWEMPAMNGLETLKKIRQTTHINHTPIIMATGKMTSVENLKTALEAGANDYIRKPFDAIEIMARVNAMIALNNSYSKILKLQKQVTEQEIRQLNKEIQNNKQLLASTKMRIISQNNRQIEVIRQLNNIKRIVPDKVKPELLKIISNIQSSLKTVNWNEFEMLFENVHPDFYLKLNNKFPNLTSSERRICAFIKMEMSLKEISAITNKSVEAVRKARYRLKQKLGIDNDSLLTNFILNL